MKILVENKLYVDGDYETRCIGIAIPKEVEQESPPGIN
jgi:hypothetical protein